VSTLDRLDPPAPDVSDDASDGLAEEAWEGDLPLEAAPEDAPRERTTAWLMLLLGAIGLAAAGALLVERIFLLIDPAYVPSCSFNPVLSCGSVMTTPQASVFGFPNPIIGVATFPVVITTAAAMLAGARMRRWYWLGMQAGVTFGLVAVHWLIFQSLYRIGALCPYCMVVWAAMVPLFAVVTSWVARSCGWTRRTWVADLVALRWWLVGLWFVVVTALIGIEFWDYWRTLL
jgi:uncharacterized membrane protein